MFGLRKRKKIKSAVEYDEVEKRGYSRGWDAAVKEVKEAAYEAGWNAAAKELKAAPPDKPGTWTYGHGKTFHGNEYVNVEVHNGRVVSVWFRCVTLPFRQTIVDHDRAEEMSEAEHQDDNLVAVVFRQ